MIKEASPKHLYPEYQREEKKVPKKTAIVKTKHKDPVDSASVKVKQEIITEAREHAESVIEQAKIKAQAILDSARQEALAIADTAKVNGFDRGYEDGCKQGFEKGLEQYKQATKHSIDNLTEIIEDVILQREKLIKSTEKEVIDIAFAIAEKVIDTEVFADNNAVVCSVRKALEKVVSDTRIKLKIAPQDYEAIRDQIDILAGKTGVSSAIDIIADANISPGGCLIDTDSGRIDVQIGAQLEELRKSLMKQNGKH